MIKYIIFLSVMIIGYFIAITPLINNINQENNLTTQQARLLDI